MACIVFFDLWLVVTCFHRRTATRWFMFGGFVRKFSLHQFKREVVVRAAFQCCCQRVVRTRQASKNHRDSEIFCQLLTGVC
uniref:Putative secreted protein n=1 Tax=Anopheles marajoara TaxID=58244 RepID=A0A2M4CBK3_9DIPT